jgi:hypothetical protein
MREKIVTYEGQKRLQAAEDGNYGVATPLVVKEAAKKTAPQGILWAIIVTNPIVLWCDWIHSVHSDNLSIRTIHPLK